MGKQKRNRYEHQEQLRRNAEERLDKDILAYAKICTLDLDEKYSDVPQWLKDKIKDAQRYWRNK